MAVNVASQKVMEHVGMSVVAQIPTPEDMQGVEGAERGGFRFEITKEQWDRLAGAVPGSVRDGVAGSWVEPPSSGSWVRRVAGAAGRRRRSASSSSRSRSSGGRCAT